ncbi:MAG TPA: MFS transporter [Usitatibacter sp.]|nr:MFS transporter [Usitatibacter sp.]
MLWLAGLCLRMTVLAIPPVIPMLHESLALTQAQIGALASLPVLLLSFAAIPGSFLIARFGAARVLVGGIVLAGLAGALRGASFDALTLFATTFAMGVGIAVMQPAFPSIVREWAPQRVGLATAVYSNGLLVGEAMSASLTIPFVLPMVGGNWRASLVAWSVPVFAIAAVAFFHARTHERRAVSAPARGGVWWPDWRSPLTWRLGFIAGGCSSLYFATNAFLPDYLRHLGRADLIAAALAAINWVQIPASFLLLAFPGRLMQRRWPLAATGVLATIAMVGIATGDGPAIVFWSGIVGFCTAFVLILTLALPPMLVEASHVHSVSAAVFAIGYLWAVITPVLGGFAWDVTGVPWSAFVPAGAFGIVIVALALGLDLTPASRRAGNASAGARH